MSAFQLVSLSAKILLAAALHFGQIGECPGITVVRNGLAAFAAGEPRIGPYTNAVDYLAGGLVYIEKRCNLTPPHPQPLSTGGEGRKS